MTEEQQEKTYKSPQRKLVKFFEKSRDSWKAKCREAKRTVKRLKNRSACCENGGTVSWGVERTRRTFGRNGAYSAHEKRAL